MALRQLQFPYYSLQDGQISSLNLVSATPKPLDITIAIRSRSGATALAPSMTMQPLEKRVIELRALLLELGKDTTGDFSEGSVAVYFGGTNVPAP